MISIPEPCNEDFTKMTPTERGSFCSKCQIDTFDFRDLSDSEINQKLISHKGEHLCGQFQSSQLESLNRGFLNWKYQRKETFRSKFVLALVVVFGLSLFSCDTDEQNKIVELQGIELSLTDSKLNFVNAVLDNDTLNLTDYLDVNETGPEEIPLCVPGAIELVEGDIYVEEPDIYETAGVPVEYTEQIAGGMVAPTYWDYLEDTNSIENVTIPLVEKEELVGASFYEATAFPNPTVANATLKLDIKASGQFEIALFDFSGRLVRTMYSGVLAKGEQRFPVDLSQEQSGMYFVNIISSGQHETVKIQKVN